MLKLVQRLADIEANIEQVEYYLAKGTPAEQAQTAAYIRRGVCFIAYQTRTGNHFVPSKFIGHAHNTLTQHRRGWYHGGGETNRAISRILGAPAEADEKLEEDFLAFCTQLDVKPSRHDRKFWQLRSSPIFSQKQEASASSGFAEGSLIERTHWARERRPEVIQEAKAEFKAKHDGRLFCEACGFDFAATYGAAGEGLIEAHHTLPVSEMQTGHITRVQDIRLLCANCHRMIHYRRPWLTVEQLKKLLVQK